MEKFFLAVLLLFFFSSLVKIFLRKAFDIKKVKKEFFSYNHVNSLHGKIDWTLRIVSFVANISFVYLTFYKGLSFNLFLFGLLILLILDYSVTAFFQWKYSEDPKQSILTVSEMSILAFALGAAIWFDLLSSLT
ncbi:DUF4181 domain-containing protein [Planococcus shenhongbingii]|uniref:DUF4181 domain-containing protein n=1 Tax=Planococcus shenhongbingii TaxID=3058398 RepID=A0ABT8NEU3_9BACL|nr:DUF4181 domain-containing protein [Planococcus sp. N017]MDN7246405.1 DUF4181 domain-containing protein [Planococcus sp. N017]